MAAAALFLGERLEKTGVAGSLCWCLSGVGTMGVVYSAVLPTFSGDRPSDACPVKEGFLDQIFPGVGVSPGGLAGESGCTSAESLHSPGPRGLVELFL